jgi:hypothetical protein
MGVAMTHMSNVVIGIQISLPVDIIEPLPLATYGMKWNVIISTNRAEHRGPALEYGLV